MRFLYNTPKVRSGKIVAVVNFRITIFANFSFWYLSECE